GGALMGVVSAAIKFAGVDLKNSAWAESAGAQGLALGMYILLCIYLVRDSMRISNQPPAKK
ncbi:MAG TPA: hypothetical protein PLO31_05780, partial [Dysgonamonadaceae bacterium]|nr:hypothetical protein [Dysgonamonadaceae bacterium]